MTTLAERIDSSRSLRIVEERKAGGSTILVRYSLEMLSEDYSFKLLQEGFTVLDKDSGQPHYLGKSSYDTFLGKVNSVLSFLERRHISFDCAIAEAPSLNQDDLIIPVSRYLH